MIQACPNLQTGLFDLLQCPLPMIQIPRLADINNTHHVHVGPCHDAPRTAACLHRMHRQIRMRTHTVSDTATLYTI